MYDELRSFMSADQYATCCDLALHSEEKRFFNDALGKLCTELVRMPVTYEQDGAGKNAIAHLHYFNHNSDAWITELDVLPEQRQAFGMISLGGMPPELGYIDLVELLKNDFALDLYWKPKRLIRIRDKVDQ